MTNICNNNKLVFNDNENNFVDQFTTILIKISKLQIDVLLYDKYYYLLKIISSNIKAKDYNLNKVMPLLAFKTNDNTKYYKYTNILKL